MSKRNPYLSLTARPLDVNDLTPGAVVVALPNMPNGAPWKPGDRFTYRRMLPGGSVVALDQGSGTVYVPISDLAAFRRASQ